MPKHKVQWVNDHTQICDRLDERVKLMQDYLDSKPNHFHGYAAKSILLNQAREQITRYRESIETQDYEECVTCQQVLEIGQNFLESYLPAYNFLETDSGTVYKRDPDFPILSKIWM